MSIAMVKTKRLQIRVSVAVADQVKELATCLGVTESAAGSLLIVAGLARVDAVLSDPKLTDVITTELKQAVE